LAVHGADGRYGFFTGRTARLRRTAASLFSSVINAGSRSQVADLFELASDLDEEVSHMMPNVEEVQATLS